MNARYKIILFCCCSFAFIGCDQVTKGLAKEHLAEGVSNSYLHDTIRLIHVKNTGAALGLGEDLHPTLSFWLLSIIPLVILFALGFYSLKNVQTLGTVQLISFCLIFAGGIGNIIDRLLYDRHVTDFINIGLGEFRTGIFNVADMCVTAGVVGLSIYMINKRSKTSTK